MPQITLSPETYRVLLSRSETFEDTAEEVVRRLLAQVDPDAPEGARTVVRGGRAAPGSILPEREYWRPILRIIEEAGGSAPANDVIELVGQRMKKILRPKDFDVLDMGEVRWRNRARFARLRMKERGLLSDSSPRGIWEITASGRRYLSGT